MVLWKFGVLPRILLHCTENVAGIHACIRVRGQGSLDPPENRRNIVFPCNAGPVKNHKIANFAFNVGHHRFASKFNVVSLVTRCRHANSAPYQTSKSWTPLPKHH